MRHPAAALAFFAACAALPIATDAQTLAITDVTVVDVREGVARPGMTVVVSGDRITAVGPAGSVAVPGEARMVDGTGRFLIPGLWDMHVHTGSDRNAREVVYPLQVAHGVTGIRNMGADCFDCPNSIERVQARRRAVAAGELIGPRVVASSDYPGSYDQAARHATEGSSPQAPATEADARAFVRHAKERGVDFIKIYDMLPREAYFGLAEEASRLGLPFAGHVPVTVQASEASDAGQRSIEHIGKGNVLEECSLREDELRPRVIAELESDQPDLLPVILEMVDTHDTAKCAALADRFVRNGTWVVPTLMVARLPSELGRGWREDPYARFLTSQERRYFERAEEAYARDQGDVEEQAPVSRWVREVTRSMHRAGVPMLAGSDAGETGVFWGIGLHQELELLVSAGFTEAEALRAATLSPAEFVEATDSLGTVEAGKMADLVLLAANPLEDISNTQRIDAVVFDGRYFDRMALDELLGGVEAAARGSDTVHVASPTGARETDRASIVAALEQVEPGGTIMFAPGTYLIGGSIDVSVPRVTLLGHAFGTTLCGCDPEELVDIEPMSRRCAGLELSGDHQTIRNLRFERMSWASLQIIGGRSDAGRLLPATTGGHLIEGNTFRDSDSFNVISDAAEPIVIRDNTFTNTYHAIAIQGRNVHALENTVSVSEPSRIPYGRADIAIGAAQFSPRGPPCADNIIAGNRIAGYPDGVGLAVFLPGTSCRGNVLRDNTISVSRVTLPPAERAVLGEEADTVVVGAAVRLLNFDGVCRAAALGAVPQCAPDASDPVAVLADNLIERNRVVGGEGIGVVIMHASNNRILDNTITGIARRDGFPSGLLRHPPHYDEGNGSGIWLSPGSNGNGIAGNIFGDIASHAVVIEGDSNRVELRSTSDSVRDLGRRVIGLNATPAAAEQAVPEWRPFEIRNVILLIGDGAGAGYWSAARVRAGRLNVERMPFTGLTDTRSADSYVTDSAAGATAYATGRRTYNGGIGVGERCAEQFAADSAAVLRDPASCDPVESLFDIAHRAGVATGLVATSSITDATPAAFGAKVPHRDHVAEIAAQLAASPIDVLLGGGKFFFDGRLPENGRDLWTPLCESARCLTVPDELRSYRADDLRLVGLFADFALERAKERQPRLAEMTRVALDRLSRSPAGFFLVVEASQPDWRGESNEPLSEVIAEMLDFDEAIGVALDVGEAAAGTLVLVVADHDAGGLALQAHADTPVAAYTTTGHTGTMTPHFAWGPGAERFGGIRDNDEIGRMLLDIARQRERELRQTGGDHVADQVTIYRDAYGVPHVHGETDAAAVFGYLYAQAEDAFDAVEREVARMTGRLAEIDGEAALSTDLYIRALETERLSREEYERASPFFRAMADAWAAGLNYYLDRHPEVTPRVIQRFEPWQMFAVAGRSEMFGAPLVHGVLRTSEVARALDGMEPGRGSNMWMIGPQKSATGRAMIFINPHNEPETYLEGHLLSDEGLNVYGGNRPGRPLPVFGHTVRHGWTMTNNGPDVADLWRETFDDPTNPLAYRYGDGYRVAEEWSETVRVRTDSGPVAREVTFRKTHHGPIVAVRDGVPLALRIARWEEGGTVQQFHAMARARSFEEFRDAVGRLREIWLSIGYADADGNIWYVHNGAVPRRSPEFDWSAPVDGSDTRTEWQGYHDLDELPQVLNPASGWLMNTNHSPFRVTAEGENPDPADYPPYMVQPHFGLGPTLATLFDSLGDNARSRASRRILSGQDRFTFEEWAEAAMSKRAWEADADIPALVATWERLRETDPARAAPLGPAVETLRSWDRVSRHQSVAMTLYTLLKMRQLYSWIASLEDLPFTPPAAMDIEPLPRDRWDDMDGLERVIALLERDWGTWRVPYGELSRLQRSPNGRYTDENPSVPVLGGFPEAGMIQLFIPFPVEGQKRWYGFVSGNSYVSVVEFGASVRARSVNGSGQSTDPASPHYTDQAELYGHGGFKPAWTILEEVQANAVRTYRRGAEREGGRQ